MKKITFTLLFLCLVGMGYAQDSTAYARKLHALIEDAKQNFASSKGEMILYDTAEQKKYYELKVDMLANKQFLLENLDDHSMAALFYFDLADVEKMNLSSPFLSATLDKLNAMHSSGNYHGRDINNKDESSTTELTDASGNYIMEFTTSAKDHYMKLLVYSKSWGKR